MSDLEQGSLQYFHSRASHSLWLPLLRALADELNAQMPPEELRSFFFAIGGRIAAADPLPAGTSLADLERNANHWFGYAGWGWVKIRDLQSSLEFVHACAPLRQAFGDVALAWSPAVIEGIYAAWLKRLGASGPLELHQVGGVEGPVDVLRFRLAHPSYFV
ncbi:MAG: hypothetical protein JWQ90_3152 [Hydrocarboniphaga sp.]|uniref:cellulose biosynthesis protein BcsD n=1 Tax=Hydrocarboniphaga sp. TaxID=2033016 RepID=UPI00262A27D1|nr:hypothetical protein [Hydrocarboniphaga sp.]MDB5970702.1 hypothetical protein [Hydrocarboniphaga sp.]